MPWSPLDHACLKDLPMKWTFSIKNKAKASAALLLLCGVVLFSNYRLRTLSDRVADAVETIYKDRLVVQDLIFSYARVLEALKGQGTQAPAAGELERLRLKVDTLDRLYLDTWLTDEEAQVFQTFSQNLNKALEMPGSKAEFNTGIMDHKLERLEEIQMEQAKLQMDRIETIRRSQETGFYLETAILVVLLIVVQALVMSNTVVSKVARDVDINMN